MYGVLDGGPYAMGDTFPITIKQIETGGSFIPKLYYVPVALAKEQIQIFNKGPQAVYRIVDLRLQAAALTMSARLAVALYNEGQTAARALHVNGLAEILNDGTNNSWTAAAYSTYGTLTRGGAIGTALNSPMTNPTASVAGPITYKLLEEFYNSVCIGDEYPNLIVSTNLGHSYIKEKFQPQWRVETQDPNIGFNGVKFNSAMIIQSQYAPGQVSPEQASSLGYTAPASGETLWFLNTKYFKFHVTNDPEFGFGFSGFKPAQDSTVVAGQYFYSGNITCQSPRLSRHAFGITG